MENDQMQQEAEAIEERDDSAKDKGRNAVIEEVSPMGQRVLNTPPDSFTAAAISQIIDQRSAEEDEPSPIIEHNIAAQEEAIRAEQSE